MERNKRGWIRLVEATIAILIISGLLFMFIGERQVQREDISLQVYEAEAIILREIQLNEVMRQEILDANPLPIEWIDFNNANLEDIALKIKDRAPSYLACEAKICKLDESCPYSASRQRDIYAQATAITSTKTDVDFRQLKLFCWVK